VRTNQKKEWRQVSLGVSFGGKGKQKRSWRQRMYLGAGETEGTGWRRQQHRTCRGRGTRDMCYGRWRRRHSQAATGGATAAWISSWARGEGAGGVSWQRLAKGEEVQGGTMWVSRPLRLALHSLSSSARKNVFFACKYGRSFPFGCAGPTNEHCPLFFGPCLVISQAPRRRETHVLFFQKSPLGFRGALFIAFRAKSFRPHGSSRLFFFSARAAHLAQRDVRARRSCRA
jgi:hypothetical protein